MGAYIEIGYNMSPENNELDIGLNRTSSDAVEALLDDALQVDFHTIHQIVMKMLVLDLISFAELDETDFNIAIKAVRNCIAERQNPTEWEAYQKVVWEEDIEPLVQQDERYQKD